LNFDKEADKVYKEFINDIKRKGYKYAKNKLKSHLKAFNSEIQVKLLEEVKKRVRGNYEAFVKDNLVVNKITLSIMLYNNARETEIKIAKILNEAHKLKKTLKNVSMEIYDGYKTDVKNIDAKKILPKYLTEDKDALLNITKLKTKPLLLSYKKVREAIEKADAKALEKSLYVAMNEKMRYYATRIAITELHRATMAQRAKEYLDDNDVEYVRFEMSSSHPKVDICDFYSSLDYGLGRGVVPKGYMRTLPLHPNCHCVYSPYYGKIKKQTHFKDKSVFDKTLNNFSEYDQKQILGSSAKLEEYKRGKGIEDIFNDIRPKYPILKYSDILK